MAAPTPVFTTLVDSRDEVIIKCYIPDGDTDLTTTMAADVSTLTTGATGNNLNIKRLIWSISGFSAILLFDADTDHTAVVMAEGTGDLIFAPDPFAHGIQNPRSAGVTGDILLATNGIPDAEGENDGEQGFFIMFLEKNTV